MNKKLIVFICILSLLVPFLPQFDFEVKAYVDTTSQNSFIQDLIDKYQTYFGSNGVVVNSDWYNTTYPQGLLNDICDHIGITPIDNDFSSAIYDYSVTNNQTADMIFNDTSQYVNNIVRDNLSYYLYDFISVDDFFNNYNFSNYLLYGYNLYAFKSALNQVVSDSDSVYIAFAYNGIYQGNIFKFSRSYFDNNFLYLSEGDFYGFNTYKYQIFEQPDIYTSTPTLNGRLSFSDGLSSVSVDAVNYQFYVDSSGQYSHYNILFNDISNQKFFCGGVIKPFDRIAFQSTVGSFFLTSGDSFSVPVFKSANLINSFKRGDAFAYSFDSSVVIPNGADIDYSRLYDIISTEVSHNTDNVILAINNAANNYLQQQVDLLHDINNALNDGTGQSWLRRIFGLLDYNFPLTLQAFDDLIEAIQNLSVSGGGDFSEATRVLHEIDDKLGFLIEQPLDDATAQDFDELKSIAGSKFPFCIFSDIVAITVILNRPPRAPDINFPMPTLGSASDNVVHVDLTPYEYARPYVHGALIFLFVIGLMALSVKIFSALKG